VRVAVPVHEREADDPDPQGLVAVQGQQEPLGLGLARRVGAPGGRGRRLVVFGGRAPDLPRALLQRILAYRIQADAAGDLDPTTIKLLDRLGRGEISEIPLPELRAVKPGTLLVREWEGTLQRVVVLESGFAWNGVTYESLSKVARAITGTNWNGPRFFGLRDRARAS
jgi:hypothetical protein